MASAKVDAQALRTRDALILPFKRRIASLTIRSENWTNSADAQTPALARAALDEVDEQLTGLADLRFPAELKAGKGEAEVEKVRADYTALRRTIAAIAGK